MDWEIERRADLMQALKSLPGGTDLSDDEIESRSLYIWIQVGFSRQDARSNNRQASTKASERELILFHDLCKKLADHIDGMHEPSVNALAKEGFLVTVFAEKVRKIQEGAHFAFGSVKGEEVRGRKPEIVASQVAEVAGQQYHDLTGKIPTLTTDPLSGKVSGVWPDFLQSVFYTLSIQASVASQSRTVSEKMRLEIGL